IRNDAHVKQGHVSASTSGTGIIIPLYTYPGSTWAEVVAVAKSNKHVPIMAIVNPNSGPGTRQDGNYISGISYLQSAGVTVLGYVPTGYASRSISDVRASVGLYKRWYPVDGIFFDEMPNASGQEGYCSALGDHAKSLGFTRTVGNPGAPVPASYVGTLDTLVIYEGRGLPSLSLLRSWRYDEVKSKFAVIAYGVDDLEKSYLSEASPYLGYVYVTNAGLPNAYVVLPPYLASIAEALECADRIPIEDSAGSWHAKRGMHASGPKGTRRLFQRVNIRKIIL
ncbi:MAG: spherulation-specific family 4 protein, partial [Thaumarchaeota archaeon]|nr:spherulation-specific family 4 protein [Nitrososphaerota archaeon]